MTSRDSSPNQPSSGALAPVGWRYLIVIAAALGGALVARLLSRVGGEVGASARQLSDLLAVFGVALPSVAPVVAGLRLPGAIGARGLAFPRLFHLGFALHLAGMLLLIIATGLHQPGAMRAGWLLYGAYDPTLTNSSVLWLLAGVGLVTAAVVLNGLNVVVSVHTLRRPGLTWRRLPLGVGALYAHGIISLSAGPLLLMTVLSAAAERTLHLGILQSTLDGDATVFQHLYWGGMHPLLLTALVPVLGLALEALAARTAGAAALPGQRRAFVMFTLLAYAGYGQHLVGRGASDLFATLSSFYALVGLAPLSYLVLSGLRRVRDWPTDRPARLVLALAAVTLTTALMGLGLGSGALCTNQGHDISLFGRLGRDLAVMLVAVGLLMAAPRPTAAAAA